MFFLQWIHLSEFLDLQKEDTHAQTSLTFSIQEMKSRYNQVNHCLVIKQSFILDFNLSFYYNYNTIMLISQLTGHVIGTGGTKVVDIPVRAGIGWDSEFAVCSDFCLFNNSTLIWLKDKNSDRATCKFSLIKLQNKFVDFFSKKSTWWPA